MKAGLPQANEKMTIPISELTHSQRHKKATNPFNLLNRENQKNEFNTLNEIAKKYTPKTENIYAQTRREKSSNS